MGASDSGTDNNFDFEDKKGGNYEAAKEEIEGEKTGIKPIGLATTIATTALKTSFPLSLLASGVAMIGDKLLGTKNVISGAELIGKFGTTKGRTGTGAPRSMLASSPQKSAPNYNKQFSSDTGNKFGDEGEQGDNRQRQTQVSSAPPSPQSTQVAELDELEDQMAQARRGRYGRRTSMFSPGNTGSGYS